MPLRSTQPGRAAAPRVRGVRWRRRLEYGLLALAASTSLATAFAVSEASASSSPAWVTELARTTALDDRDDWTLVAAHPPRGAGDGGAIVLRFAAEREEGADDLVDPRSILVVCRSRVLDSWVVLTAADAWRESPGIPLERLSERTFVDAWRCDIDVRARLIRDTSFDRVTRAVREAIERIERIRSGPGMSLRSASVLDDGR